MTTTEPPRWHYRFANYRRAFLLLQEALDKPDLTQLEQEGTIQRFEYTMELAWKVMKDYLEAQNLVLRQVTPKAVIRAASEAQLIDDAEAWMDALDDRNRMSHTYDSAHFEEVLDNIRDSYFTPMDDLRARLFQDLESQQFASGESTE
ncbi:MAG: nucleotidyltransferase substrate binding protein [Acidobacteria bacterium]|nr:nucleotidyltransferase substrate binding protein [Acidobacteriota bacterium]